MKFGNSNAILQLAGVLGLKLPMCQNMICFICVNKLSILITGVGQNKVNTRETDYISLLMCGVGPQFA